MQGHVISPMKARKHRNNTEHRSVLIASFSNLSTDPRVRRHIASLRHHYVCHAAGFDDPNVDGVTFHKIATNKPRAFFAKFIHAFWSLCGFHHFNLYSREDVKSLQSILRNHSFDLVLANDIETLPVVIAHRQTARVLFDAHEFSPKEFSESLRWRLLHGRAKSYFCKHYLQRADAMTTVGAAISDEYARNYQVKSEVIYNAPKLSHVTPKLAGKRLRIIHHGAALRGRKLELMIEVMRHLPDTYHLDLMLMPSDAEYLAELKEQANALPNVRFVPTVSTEAIVQAISKYDIGLYLLYPSNFNNLMALPNKFFEFIQARLAIFVGPSPEMAGILKQFGNGVAISSFDPIEMAREIQRYSRKEIYHMKKSSAKAAKVYCMENEQKKLMAIVENLLKSNKRVR